MNVKLHRILNREEEQVIIECVDVTQEIEDIRSYVLTKGKELSGMTDGRLSRFLLEDVLYFEAVDERLFAYTQEHIFEFKARLYEVEAAYEKYHFIRCSKSIVLNLMHLNGISPALNGRFTAHMQNGERLIISRQYVPALKQKVMGGGK